jgi:hypothetical protein
VGSRDFVVRSSSSEEVSVETSSAVELGDEDELDSLDVSSGGFVGVSFGGGEGVRCAT